MSQKDESYGGTTTTRGDGFSVTVTVTVDSPLRGPSGVELGHAGMFALAGAMSAVTFLPKSVAESLADVAAEWAEVGA